MAQNLPQQGLQRLVGLLTGLKLHDHNCGLKLFTADVASEIRIYGELHRFIAVLAHARGFSVAEQAVNHRPREHGVSKYGVRRFLRGLLDLLTVTFLTGYGQRPQHLLGAVGLASFAFGFLGLGYLACAWVAMNVFGVGDPAPIGGRPLLLYSIASLLLGAQALSLRTAGGTGRQLRHPRPRQLQRPGAHAGRGGCRGAGRRLGSWPHASPRVRPQGLRPTSGNRGPRVGAAHAGRVWPRTGYGTRYSSPMICPPTDHRLRRFQLPPPHAGVEEPRRDPAVEPVAGPVAGDLLPVHRDRDGARRQRFGRDRPAGRGSKRWRRPG